MANVALFENQSCQIESLTEELARGGHDLVAQTSRVDEAFHYLHLMGDGKLPADIIIVSPRLEDGSQDHSFDHLHRGETSIAQVPYGLLGRTKPVEIPRVTSLAVRAAEAAPYETDAFIHARAILQIVRGLELPTKVITNSALRMATIASPFSIDAELGQLPERVNAVIEAVLYHPAGG